jgi:hypothetical protein
VLGAEARDPHDVIIRSRLCAVTAIGGATVRRIRHGLCLAAVVAVVLPAAGQPPPAAALDSGPRQATSSHRPAREGRSQSSPSDDLTCPGIDAGDIAKLRDSPDLRPDIDELCHTLATMKYTNEKPYPFPTWIVLVAAVVGLAFGLGLIWYYCIQRDTDIPWFWSGWPWP